MIRLHFSISQVMTKHHRNVQYLVGFGGHLTMDTFLCEQNIPNITKKLVKETYKKHENNSENVRMWV